MLLIYSIRIATIVSIFRSLIGRNLIAFLDRRASRWKGVISVQIALVSFAWTTPRFHNIILCCQRIFHQKPNEETDWITD